jgi:RimJ/RimL family protein N-acetyltransferase
MTSIRRLTVDDISEEYLRVLNDSSYMQYSKNSLISHTHESQTLYIESSWLEVNKITRYLFGIFVEQTLKGSLTLEVNYEQHNIDIGLLVFRSVSGMGIGSQSVKVMVRWILARFPTFDITIGASKMNVPMISIAISCGFEPLSDYNSEIQVFKYVKQNTSPLVTDTPSLFFGTDTGGVEKLLELYLREHREKELVIKGQGQGVARYYYLNYSQKLPDKNRFNQFVYSTGTDVAPIESIQRYAFERGKQQICVLDNWVNYKSRFNVSKELFPDQLLVTNKVAFEIASRLFGNHKLTIIPDFQLERIRNLLLVGKHVCEATALVVLEPTRESIEGIEEINLNSFMLLEQSILLVQKAYGVDKVLIRLHPKMGEGDATRLFSNISSFSIANRSTRIEEDLCCVRVVIGFSSTLLYLTSELNIPTYTILKHEEGSWLSRSHKILSIAEL